jgi:phytoene synthase
VARYRLPAELLTGLIAARRFDLYDDPMRTLADFDDYAGASSSAVFELSARILGDSEMRDLRQLSLHAGLGHAIAGLLQALPVHAARGQLFVPLEILERHGGGPQDIAGKHANAPLRAALAEMRGHAREHLAQAGRLATGLPVAGLPALLPVALARPMLERMERADYDPFRPPELPQWRRQWLIWRAARRPSRIFA